MDEDDVFDFEMEVAPIVEVLSSKTLEQSLLEVLEEEELIQVGEYRRDFQQSRNAQLADVQRLQARDDRVEAEKAARVAEAKIRIEQERIHAEKVAAARSALAMVDEMEEQIIQKLQTEGVFYDGVNKQVQDSFIPWLQRAVDKHVSKRRAAKRNIDAFLASAAARVGFMIFSLNLFEIPCTTSGPRSIRSETAIGRNCGPKCYKSKEIK